MEFLPLEKYSANKRNKKSLKGVKRKVQTSVDESLKKPRKNEVKKSFVSKTDDDVDVENKSVEENVSKRISQPTKDISEDKTSEKPQIPRLFVNMKKVILNEEEVKDIHRDIIAVRFPRKKRSRWCWAVFDSKEKAEKALKELKDRHDVIVTKPHDQKKKKSKDAKVSKSKQKKTIKTKIRNAWM